MCGSNVQKIANLGRVLINTANSNLDGTGAIGTVLQATTGSSAGGTTISSVIIKATGNTSLGMVRLFIKNTHASYLYKEVMVPANDQTGVVPAFSATVNMGIVLQPGYSLMASTQNSENSTLLPKVQTSPIAPANTIFYC